MKQFFCTYFNGGYLSRGLALTLSMNRWVPDFDLEVLNCGVDSFHTTQHNCYKSSVSVCWWPSLWDARDYYYQQFMDVGDQGCHMCVTSAWS